MKRKQEAAPIRKLRFRSILIGIIVGVILLFALFVRCNTFWLSHWQGDQSHYLALAMKLDRFGLDHYNLRGIKIKFIKLDQSGRMRLAYVVPAEDISEKGDILRGLELFGINYYDMPLYYKAPAFPYALMLSHKLFAKPNQPYSVGWANVQGYLRKVRPNIFVGAQLYAVIVPLFFSLGTIIITFFLGKVLFSDRVGLYASFLMAINPVSILISQKLLSDDMATFFIAVSMLLFILAFKSCDRRLRETIFSMLGGMSCGIAILAKQSVGLFAIAIWIFTIVTYPKEIWNIRWFPRALCNKKFLLFTVGIFLVSGFWFLKVHQVYGEILKRGSSAAVDQTGWDGMVRDRPHGWILFLIGLSYLCPPFAVAYFSLKRFVINVKAAIVKKAYDYRFLFLWIAIVVFAFYYRSGAGQEHRRMLPVYPCMALLVGYCLDRARVYSGRWSVFMPKPHVREIIICILLIACAAWSVPFAIEAAMDLKVLLRVPF